MSLLNKTWELNKPASPGFIKLETGYPKIVSQLLASRGIKTKKGAEKFLNPDYYRDTHSPGLLKDIDIAVKRISRAIKNKEKILIYGDYDADGICSSTLLKEGLEKFGARKLSVYIPHRNDEGYGLNIPAVKKFIKQKVNLIITVDCGSTNIEEIKFAQDKGIDVIVIDHHQVLENKKFCYALINPHQKGDKYPFKDICATAVVFKVVQALNEKLKAFDEEQEKWFLDLVAIATVTDVMPLLDENRVFVKYGLKVLGKTRREGLKALIEVSRSSNLDSYALGFILGPRINSAGRMAHADLAFNLLNAKDPLSAKEYAEKLEQKNKERQKVVADILDEIDFENLKGKEVIFEGREHWPIGVLGIVAGRMADMFGKPSFIYQKKEAILVGSARTPYNFNTVEIFESCSDVLEKFGGHRQAGGFTANIENEQALGKGISEYVLKSAQSADNLLPPLSIDAEVGAEDVNYELYNNILLFEPYGEANPKPNFILKQAKLKNPRLVGSKNTHFKCAIEKDGRTFSAIGFNMAESAADFQNEDIVDIVFNIDINDFNGTRNLDLKLIDIKRS